MTQEVILYQRCPQCGGRQEFESASGEGIEPIPCNWPGCAENGGYVEFGKAPYDPGLNDILDKCNDIINLCNDILELLG